MRGAKIAREAVFTTGLQKWGGICPRPGLARVVARARPSSASEILLELRFAHVSSGVAGAPNESAMYTASVRGGKRGRGRGGIAGAARGVAANLPSKWQHRSTPAQPPTDPALRYAGNVVVLKPARARLAP